MTLQERSTYHADQYRDLVNRRPMTADFHRSASDYFCMAQVSIDQRDVKGATYRYRQGCLMARRASVRRAK